MGQVADVIGGALLLRPDAFRDVVLGRDDVMIAVLVLAGVSLFVGQSVVLALSRVRPVRFVLALVLTAVTLTAEIAVWTIGFWLTAGTAGSDIGPYDTFRVVVLAHAPYLFSFLVLMPYFGRPIQRVIEVWTLVAITVGLVATTALDVGVVLLAVTVGFAFHLLVTVAVGRWLAGFDRWLWRTVTGTRVRVRAEDAVAMIRQGYPQDTRRSGS